MTQRRMDHWVAQTCDAQTRSRVATFSEKSFLVRACPFLHRRRLSIRYGGIHTYATPPISQA